MQIEERMSLFGEIKQDVRDRIDLNVEMSDDEVEEIVINAVLNKSRDKYMSISEKSDFVAAVFNAIRRLDILEPLLADSEITEIMINGPEMVFVEKQGHIKKMDIRFESRQKLEDVIQSIVAKVNRVVNESTPIVDARLKDGSRVNVVLPPVAINGPILTIRKFPEKPLTMEQLVGLGALTDEAVEFLEKAVKAKYNIFISGGTGSGKTTFLNALSHFIPKDERIITIEDSAELQIQGIENIIRMETRNANTEGKGEICIRELIKASLRMRPERIIVGEVRGAEAIDMLQAMNTGHDGSLSTGHANSSIDMLSRLESMVLSGANLPLDAIRQQIASAIDIIIHLSRMRDKSRRVLEIVEISRFHQGVIEINPIFTFEENNGNMQEKICGTLVRTRAQMLHMDKFRRAGICV